MNKIENIYYDFRRTFKNDPDFVISFYVKHMDDFTTKRNFNYKEELKLYIELTSQYLSAMLKKELFKETIIKVNKFKPFIDSEIDRLNANDLKIGWYNDIIFTKGVASYQLKDYKSSTLIFKSLCQADIQNENCKHWLNYSLYKKRLQIVRRLNFVFGFIVILEILLRHSIQNYYLKQLILIIGSAGLISNWFYTYYLNRVFRKSNTRLNPSLDYEQTLARNN